MLFLLHTTVKWRHYSKEEKSKHLNILAKKHNSKRWDASEAACFCCSYL